MAISRDDRRLATRNHHRLTGAAARLSARPTSMVAATAAVCRGSGWVQQAGRSTSIATISRARLVGRPSHAPDQCGCMSTLCDDRQQHHLCRIRQARRLFGNNQGYWTSLPNRANRSPAGLGFLRSPKALPGRRGRRSILAIIRWRACGADRRQGRRGLHRHHPRRTTLPPIYNQYQRVERCPIIRAADRLLAVFPAVLTGWLIAGSSRMK